MKICAIICEYNPFHNGHLYQLNLARERSDSDAIVCLMSGDFVQRGEASIMDKRIRANHALQAGADVVVELPTVFATSPAELFASGAIKLLSSIPTVNTLCFGAETADKLAFKSASKYLADEPREVSLKIKQALDEGVSYAKARAQAFAGFIPLDLLLSPNNILGLEYTKAIYRQNASIDILPIERQGAGYSENAIYSNFSSASALRLAIQNGQSLGDNLPKYVLSDLPSNISNGLELLEKYAILNKKASEIAKVCDCSEGLENAFKRVASENKPLVESLTSTRYTASRIRRIALQNLLNIEEQFIRDCLQAPLYLRVLGVKKGRNDLLSALSESPFPLLVRPRDKEKLQGVAKECFEKDIFAEKVYSLLYPPVSF